METQKLRVKIGPHEFDGEGPTETVTTQYADWLKAIAEIANQGPQPSASYAKPTATITGAHIPSTARLYPPSVENAVPVPAGALSLEGQTPTVINEGPIPNVFREDQKRGIVMLRVHPTGDSRNADAVLMVLYSYKRILGRDEVLSGHIKDALEESGIRLARVDRTIDGYVREGLLLKAGHGKGGKYRLTQIGYARAESLAKALAEQMV